MILCELKKDTVKFTFRQFNYYCIAHFSTRDKPNILLLIKTTDHNLNFNWYIMEEWFDMSTAAGVEYVRMSLRDYSLILL